MSDNVVVPAASEDTTPIWDSIDDPKQPACAEDHTKEQSADAVLRETSNDEDNEVFKQFVKFFRYHCAVEGPTKDQTQIQSQQPERDQESQEGDLCNKVKNTRCLWNTDGDQTTGGTGVWDYQGATPINFEWERILMRTSCVEGIEDWMKQLEIPDVPDNRVKIIFASISAEMRKLELCNQLQQSVLQTDWELCPVMIQMQVNKSLERMRLIKYSVETLEDVLSLLSAVSVESKYQLPLFKQLTTTLHRDSLTELLQISHARKLILVSIGVLFVSDFRSHAFEVFKILMFDAVYDEAVSHSDRASILTDIIERCNAEELLWLTRNILALYAAYEELPKSRICTIVTGSVLKKASDLNCRSNPDWKKVIQKLAEANPSRKGEFVKKTDSIHKK